MAKKKPKKLVTVAECNEGNPKDPRARIGSWRYCVTCDALQKGEPVELQHPWRAMTPEEAIARVKANNPRGLNDITNCKAVEIPGSYKK